MSSVRVDVVAAAHAWVQDLGRPGRGRLGVAVGGAADGHAARTAHVLVGNDIGAPLLEVTASELVLVPRAPVLLAVTGAARRVLVGGVGQPAREPLVVRAGDEVRVETPPTGLRSYVALNGRLDAPAVLGSVAPDRLLGCGTALVPGEPLLLDTDFVDLDHPHLRVPLFRMGVVAPDLGADVVVDVTPGPESGQFAADALAGTWEVSPRSDHVGLRVLGPTPIRSTDAEILSRGVPLGAVEAPPGGGLLVLLRGRLVTAGYPVVAVATSVGLDRLGQARPGDRLRFRARSVDEAVADLRGRERALDALAERVRRALTAAGAGHVVAHRPPPRPGIMQG